MNYEQLARRRTIKKAVAQERAKTAEVAATRQCGECTLCCTIMGIEELNKPPGIPCPKLNCIGCSIYGSHPHSCQVYACMWRMGILEDEELRPDRCGVIFDQVFRPELNSDEPSIATRYKTINVREEVVGNADKGLAKMAVIVLGSRFPLLFLDGVGQVTKFVGPPSVMQAMMKEVDTVH